MKAMRLVLGAAVLLALAACTNEPDETEYASKASISSTDAAFAATSDGGTITFKAEGGDVLVYVDCGTDWSLKTESTGWLSAMADVQSGTVTVSAGQSTVEEEKTGTITLSTTTSGITFATITVTQSAYNYPEITVSPSEWNAPAAGALSITITVEASDEWSASTSASWLTVDTSASALTLTAAENTEAEERYATVTLSCSDGVKTSTATVTVTQDAQAYVKLGETEVNFEYSDEDSYSFSVSANFDVTYSADDWITCSVADGTLTVNVAENDTRAERSATVTVTAGDGAENVAEAQFTVSQGRYSRYALIYEYTTTEDDYEITFFIDGDVDCMVDWGDGSDLEHVTTAQPTHTYATAGVYDVSAVGKITHLYIGSTAWATASANGTPLTAVIQWGKPEGLTSMYYALYYAKYYTSIPADTEGAFSDVETFEYAFYNSQALEAIPEGLLTYATKATSFKGLFYNNSHITEIPEGMFDTCTSAEILDGLFQSFSALTAIPKGIFDNCTKATSFKSTFASCSSLGEIPAGLFDKCPNVTTFYQIFYSCKSLTTIPEGLFDNCPDVENFYYAFCTCSGLTSVPTNLFDNNKKVTSFQQTFMSCSKWEGESPYTEIDGTKVHLYERADHPDVFVKPTAYTNCFSSCSKLTDYSAAQSAGWVY